ncbi:hypothetical protein [Streptomyces sp. NPDC003077]|uniref:hypothetical protein n=1 Tax=Streptomyces sp. NPDC003077 TaxID=3154443 RepID=UPI0033B92C45
MPSLPQSFVTLVQELQQIQEHRMSGSPAEPATAPQSRTRFGGCVIAPLVGGLVALVGTFLLGRIWQACDIGVNAAANGFGLLLAFVPAWALATAWWGMSLLVVGRRSKAAALVLAVLGSLAVVWGLVAWQHEPGGSYPVSQASCAPDNVPRWWPGWLPV